MYSGYPTAAIGSVYPTSILAKRKDNVQFNCIFNGDIEWKFEGGALPDNAKTQLSPPNHKLVISKVNNDNHGKYSCEGVTATNVQFKEIAWLILKSNNRRTIFIALINLFV